MVRILGFAILAAFGLASMAQAKCPTRGSTVKWNLHSDDQRVSGSYLEGLLSGKKVKYNSGLEIYKANGKYSYKANGKSYKAPGYRIYKDGQRCIDYSGNPRFDLYVVNNGKLVLINAQGGRFEGRVIK